MTNSPTDRLLRALEPFAAEADRQERVRDYRDGDCRIVDCLVPIGDFRRARITLDAFLSGVPASGEIPLWAHWIPTEAMAHGSLVTHAKLLSERLGALAGELERRSPHPSRPNASTTMDAKGSPSWNEAVRSRDPLAILRFIASYAPTSHIQPVLIAREAVNAIDADLASQTQKAAI